VKVINVLPGTSKGFSTVCREVMVSKIRDSARTSEYRRLKLSMYYSNPSLMVQRLERANRLLADYNFIEPVELITDSKLLTLGPYHSIQNGFYLEMNNLGEYPPVLHSVLGFLRGGRTLELALAKAALQVCEAIGYTQDLETRLPFNGTQTFLENIWPGLWAEEFTKTVKRYKKPGFHILFASVWAHYMGFTKDIVSRLPWGFSRVDRIIARSSYYNEADMVIPTYFINRLRCEGITTNGEPLTTMVPWTQLTEPTETHVLIFPDEIWEQIPFIGKPKGE